MSDVSRRGVIAGALALSSTLMTAPASVTALASDDGEWWWALGRDFSFCDPKRTPVMFATPNLKSRVLGRDFLGETVFSAMERGARIKVAGHRGGYPVDVSQIVDFQHEGHPEAVAARTESVELACRKSVWLEGCTSFEWRGNRCFWIDGDGTVFERGSLGVNTKSHPELKHFLGLPHRHPIAIRAARLWSGEIRILETKVLDSGTQVVAGA